MSTSLVLPPPMMISAPSGSSQLPIVELDRAKVEAERVRIRLKKGSVARASADCSFGPFQQQLKIDAWPFFHAAKKTELTRVLNANHVQNSALIFAAEYSALFNWNTNNLRRVDRSLFAHEDFAEASLAGRFGEAVAYLTMLEFGYVFFDRIAVLWERAINGSGLTHAEQLQYAAIVAQTINCSRPDSEPDFAFEKSNGDVALMESKGSFVNPVADNPSTKDDLRKALKQLNAWMGMIAPTPAKSYAIGTYFRDQSDTNGDPSLIAYVDPPGEGNEAFRPQEFSEDWIRRGNYGAWLTGMGWTNAADALRHGRSAELREREVQVLRINGADFAVRFEQPVIDPDYFNRDYWMHEIYYMERWWNSPHIGYQHYLQHLHHMGVRHVRVTGIERENLSLIEDSIRSPMRNSSRDSSLMKCRIMERRTSQLSSQREGFDGSIFPDGTMYGELSLEMLWDARIERIHV